MVSEKIIVSSALGIHLRPAGAMCDRAVKYESKIMFKYADGEDEEKALADVVAALTEALKD